MKRISGYLVIAVIAAIVAVAIYRITERPEQAFTPMQQEQIPVMNTGYMIPNPELPDFTVAAEKTVHAVVHIKTEYLRKSSVYDYFFDFRDFFGYPHSNPRNTPIIATGSGVIISEDGYIVTNNHVVQDANNIEVTLNDKKTYKAQIIGTDQSTDLALIKVNPEEKLPYIEYGNSDALRIGEWVLAVGNPFNLTSTVTAGIVSAKARDINILGNSGNAIESFIQTDAAVNKGNSGGALVNTRGELVGINAAIASGTGYYNGYSFAIPVNLVRKIVDDFLNYGQIQRAYIGVTIRELNSELAKELDISNIDGVYVSGLADNGSAKKAGIEQGDIIISIDNRKVNHTSELLEIIGQKRPGEYVEIEVRRKDKTRNYNVLLLNEEGKTSLVKREEPESLDILGAEFRIPTREEFDKLGIAHGVMVTNLQNGKLKEIGVKEGFIIMFIDKIKINSIDDIKASIQNKTGGVLMEGMYENGMRAYYGFGL